jgi:hypothetical protein
MPAAIPISKDLRKLLAFGSGVGIEIGSADLEVVAARVRPSGVRVLGRLTVAGFAARPAAEWGSEYTSFLKSLGTGRLSATVLLPRRDVIVRQVALPGVARKDMESALRFQIDSLHPYGEDEVVWGWSPLAGGAALAGIARRDAVDRYIRLFEEAGVAVASFTFSAAAVHAAIRLNGAGHTGFLALGRSATGAVEAYGESDTRAVFSAEFDLPPERAAALALAELRLPSETVPLPLAGVLPRPTRQPAGAEAERDALSYATAMAGACPWLVPAANVLPPEYRRSSSRTVWIPTLVLAVLLAAAAVAMVAYARYTDRRYLRKLNAEIETLQPRAQRAVSLDSLIEKTRARALLLDRFRSQTREDLDVLNELTHLVEPPAWTSSINLTRDTVRITGEAPQAAPLIKILDSSPLFRASVLDQAPRSAAGESFQIHMSRGRR